MKYHYLFLFMIIGSFSFATETEELNSPPRQSKYKLYCMYTPKFQLLFEKYFQASIKDDFEIVAREYPQDCSSGVFSSDGWEITMLHKLELLIEAIEENWNNQIFFYSDVDIIFLKPVLSAALDCLKENDFVVQQGWPKNALCAGFFVMKGNEKTHKLIATAHHLLKEKVCLNDQIAIQTALNSFKPGEIAWKFLPPKKFPNGRRVLTQSSGHYSPDSEIILDDSIILFHANCCIGLDSKYHFLQRVQEEYLKKQSLDFIEK